MYIELIYLLRDNKIHDTRNAKIKNLQKKFNENEQIQKEQMELEQENLDLKVIC